MKTFLLHNKKKILIIFMIIVGVVCLSKVLIEYQWQIIWSELQKSNISLFLISSTISIIFYWLFRALRWQVLLRSDGVRLPLGQIYLVTGVSVGSSTITPFQSGEALKVEYLHKHGGKRLSGYAIFFAERVMDFLAVIGFGILGVSAGFDFGVSQAYFYLLAAGLLVGILTIAGIILYFPSKRLLPLKDLLQEKWRQKWSLLIASVLTVLSWIMVIAGWKFALTSVSIDINFLQASSLVSMTTLLAIISFVPGAVGVSEISITTILTKMAVASHLAQTGAIAVRAYTLMIIFWTVMHWLFLKGYMRSKVADN